MALLKLKTGFIIHTRSGLAQKHNDAREIKADFIRSWAKLADYYVRDSRNNPVPVILVAVPY